MKYSFKVTVIGGSNAFNKDNSSFLIEIERKKILFDCGLNAFEYIKRNNIDIDAVYISHTHFDHIGGLEQLIFYRYFVQNKTTTIVCADEIENEIKAFLPRQVEYDNGQLRPVSMYEKNDFYGFTRGWYHFRFIKGNHVVKDNYGLLIKDSEKHKALLITGDTKASDTIKETIENTANNGYKITVFHDFSHWDDPYKNIHCCKTDFDHYYDNLKNHKNIDWYLYHNEKFNDEYKNKVIEI